MIIQVFCVIFPLFVTDTIIVGLIVRNEEQYSIQQMNNIADSAKFTVGYSIESASLLIQKIYMNQMTDRFSNYEFENELDYYNKYNEFIKNILSKKR